MKHVSFYLLRAKREERVKDQIARVVLKLKPVGVHYPAFNGKPKILYEGLDGLKYIQLKPGQYQRLGVEPEATTLDTSSRVPPSVEVLGGNTDEIL